MVKHTKCALMSIIFCHAMLTDRPTHTHKPAAIGFRGEFFSNREQKKSFSTQRGERRIEDPAERNMVRKKNNRRTQHKLSISLIIMSRVPPATESRRRSESERARKSDGKP